MNNQFVYNFFSYAVWMVIPLIVVILSAFIWFWKLKKKVALKTRELRSELFERKCAEEELRESHKRFLTVLDSINANVYVANMETFEILYVNKHIQDTYGRNLVGESCWKVFFNESSPCNNCINEKLLKNESDLEGVYVWEGQCPITGNWHINYDRMIRWVDGHLVRLHVATDITERRKAEEQLRTSLEEKEVLLKEIHHRVKNNLQIVSSLFYLQSEYTEDRRSLDILKESQNRVRSMAMIHEQLYQSKDIARVDFAKYIQNLASNLFSSYGIHQNVIALKINVDNIFFGVDTAIPCGLIINELVSNSLSHAFPSEKKGEIYIEVSSGKEDRITLIVRDNGIGFPQDCNFLDMDSLGLRLVNTLSTQLDGEVELDRSQGTTFTITFEKPQDQKRRRQNDNG